MTSALEGGVKKFCGHHPLKKNICQEFPHITRALYTFLVHPWLALDFVTGARFPKSHHYIYIKNDEQCVMSN